MKSLKRSSGRSPALESSKTKTFDFDFYGAMTLSAKEVWPDGDAPKNPTARDVILKIKAKHVTIGQFLDAWKLSPELEVFIDGEHLQLP